jgi:hypothetical protein
MITGWRCGGLTGPTMPSEEDAEDEDDDDEDDGGGEDFLIM